MPTPTSAANGYADNADALAFHDRRLLAQLVSDTGSEVTVEALPTDPNLAKLLRSASGRLESAALSGKRYTVADLQALTGSSLEYLKQIVVDLAVGRLLWRRYPERGKPDIYHAAEEVLHQLIMGEAIFGLVEVQDAGVMETVERATSDAEDPNRIATRARRYFAAGG